MSFCIKTKNLINFFEIKTFLLFNFFVYLKRINLVLENKIYY